MASDFIPCHTFDDWVFQAAAIIGEAAAEIHAVTLTGDASAANDSLKNMIPAVDGLAAEFRQLLGCPARPDIAPE